MYLPPLFTEQDVSVMHQAIREARIATFVATGASGLVANHFPMLVESDPAPYGTLVGHVARGNPLWRDIADGSECLAVFLGPNAYITPSWYATKQETGKVVPTWNYAAVHAYGAVRFIDDTEWLRGLVTKLTQTHEAGRAAPWAVTDAPADYIAGMLRAIVGVELRVTRLEGKFKMSQNRPPVDRGRVAAGLAEEGNEAVAAIVRERDKG